MDFEEAQSLLESDFSADPSLEQSAEPASPATPDEQPQAPTPQAEAADSFIERADLESLLADVKDPAGRAAVERAYKSFQGGFTRKAQEYAPWRSLAEQGIDPDTALQAAQWYDAMSNPEVAKEFYDHLGQQLQGFGYLQPAPAEQEGPEALEDDLDDFDEDNPLVSRLSSVESMLEQMVYEREEAALQAEIRHIEDGIREANPHYGQADIDRIYQIAMGRDDYDLVAAQHEYEGWRNEIVNAYVTAKGSAPMEADVPSTAGGEQLVGPDTFIKEDGEIDFQQLDRIATLRYEQENAGF
jgi:hypothetical protein